MKKLISIIVLSLIISSCSSTNDFDKGKNQLINQGYTHVECTGYSMFCCSDEDSFSTGFTAIDKNGENIKGCMCSGVFKGVTIRFK